MVRTDRPTSGAIAVIDDDEATRLSLGQMLKLHGYDVDVFASAEEILFPPRPVDYDCIVSDVKMPGMDGERFLETMRERTASPPVIMITGHGDVPMSVRCLKAGAYDFIEKPFDPEIMLSTVARAVEKSRLERDGDDLRRRLLGLSREEEGRFGMVGKSPAMRDLYAQIEAFAQSSAPVLIFGETGAGKELVARAIHGQSPRSRGPFVPVNAGALSESMVESELFGHRRGAFTGAEQDRDGMLVTASGGTMLLDEIESISEKNQVQLLRVLEDGLVLPLGKDRPREVDVRILSTTNEDPKDLTARKHLREDFYHRIASLPIRVPPLRERVEDIPLLVSHYMKKNANMDGIPVPEMPGETLTAMMRYAWPGNVRELIHALRRMALTAHRGVIGPFLQEEGGRSDPLLSLPSTPGALRAELEKAEQRMIEAALREHAGEINGTCHALGISRRALYDRMVKYRFRKEDFKS